VTTVIALILVTVLAACATPREFTPDEQQAWIIAQQARFNVIAAAANSTSSPQWEEVYRDAARKVWALGHNGAEIEDRHWPTHTLPPGPPIITSGYHDQYNTAGYPRRLGPHSGVDIPAPVGHPVYAVHAGEVYRSEYHKRFGGHIKIKDGDKRNRAQYMHLDSRMVEVGDHVQRGQQIGTVGMTGTLTGGIPHLHLAMLYYFARGWRSKQPDFTTLEYPIR
jgi:murein DD-endopeptidase MepM/ murein hydrolase activator NlpD